MFFFFPLHLRAMMKMVCLLTEHLCPTSIIQWNCEYILYFNVHFLYWWIYRVKYWSYGLIYQSISPSICENDIYDTICYICIGWPVISIYFSNRLHLEVYSQTIFDQGPMKNRSWHGSMFKEGREFHVTHIRWKHTFVSRFYTLIMANERPPMPLIRTLWAH
jgi:hypothetical protein